MNYTDNELQQERWKDIDGYDGMYQVSDLGRVRSKKYGRWKVIKQTKDKCGYLRIKLCKNGKKKTVNIHRLVASAFIENDNIFNTEINHINEDKTDNKVSNLEWCDRKYNNTYNNIRRRCITKRCKLKPLYRPDLSIDENIEIFKENGIECSRPTVWKIRKDLNLIN